MNQTIWVKPLSPTRDFDQLHFDGLIIRLKLLTEFSILYIDFLVDLFIQP